MLGRGTSWGMIGGTLRFPSPVYGNSKSAYPTFAVPEMDASDTCFPFSRFIWRICSLRRPISSACSLIVFSLSFIIAKSLSINDVEKFCLAASLLEIDSLSGIHDSRVCFVLSISPLPVRSHSILILGYFSNIRDTLSIPILLLMLLTYPLATPILFSNAETVICIVSQ